MSECADDKLRDLLPEFLLGSASDADRARVAAHLERCPACASELAMLRAANQVLGAAPKVDIAAIVRALPKPPAAATPALHVVRGGAPVAAVVTSRRRRTISWRVAASIAMVAVGGVSFAVVQSILRGSDRHNGSADASIVVDSARLPHHTRGHTAPSSTKTDATVDSASAGVSVGGSLGDLSEQEMQTLLNEIDNMDAIPAAEPQPAVSGIRRVAGVQ